MSAIITALTSLVTILVSALTSLAGLWVVAVAAAFFVIGLAIKFIFGLMGKGGKGRRK